MQQTLGLAILAGVASSALFLCLLTGVPGMVLFAYFVQLPLMFAGLAMGLTASVVAVAGALLINGLIAGAVLVSALITGVTQRTEDSTVLPPEAKSQISAALEEEVSAMSDTQVRQILEGQPPAVVDEVVRINGDSRDRALGLALLTVGIIGLLGLLATFFIPGRKPSPQAGEASQPTSAASERGAGEV